MLLDASPTCLEFVSLGGMMLHLFHDYLRLPDGTQLAFAVFQRLDELRIEVIASTLLDIGCFLCGGIGL